MKKLFISLLTVSVVGAVAIFGTGAFFSDTETSRDNKFEAGAFDLKIDNTSYYNGTASSATTWGLADLPGHLFFDFADIKPDDWGEDTISLHVENDAYACMSITKTEDDDETCTEPEKLDDPTCDEPDTDVKDGDLGSQLLFLFWPDDGDNVLEDNESIFKQGQASTLFKGIVWTLADSLSNIWGATPSGILGGQTYYIAKAWCFGNSLQPIPLPQDGKGPDSPRTPANSTGGINCDGTSLNNAAQSDVFTADVEFTAVQKRHNTSFQCVPGASPTPSITPSPTPVCGQADVMLVLDRSGSISSSELTQLKTAANAFVTSLGLTTIGVHAGMSSFATTGSLNVHLTDTAATVQAGINALVSSGYTNLKEGIELATGEQANSGDGHDRAEPGSPDKMIVITDGHPNRPLPADTADDLAATAADNARTAGAEIFVVGVGVNAGSETYLKNEIADNAAHYYSAADYSGLQTILQNLDLCQ